MLCYVMKTYIISMYIKVDLDGQSDTTIRQNRF